MVNSISSTTAEQTQAIVVQMMAMTAQKQAGDIAMSLIEGAIQGSSQPNAANAPQDPSTVTAEQLQSPIDIRV